jgi:hypothetical protein
MVLISQQEVGSLGHVSRIGTKGARCKISDIRTGDSEERLAALLAWRLALGLYRQYNPRQDTPTPNGVYQDSQWVIV